MTIVAWFNQTFKLPAEQRSLLYKLIKIQVSAGATYQQVFDALSTDAAATPEIAKVAQLAAEAGQEGRLFSDGLEDSGCIPTVDLGIIRAAEINNQLDVACQNLQDTAVSKLSIFGSVVAPNLYYLTILSVLGAMTWQAKATIEKIGDNVDPSQITIYKLSLMLHDWGAVVLLLAMIYSFIVFYGRGNFLADARRLLAFFDSDYRAHLVIRVATISAILTKQGANHVDILASIRDAFTVEKFVSHATATATQKHVGDGQAIDDALADTLLTADMARMLKALTPGGDLTSYALAYSAIADIQRTKLTATYNKLSVMFRVGLLSCVALLLIIMIQGVYAALQAV